VYTGGDNKTGICGEDIFALGLMKFAYQEIIMELLQRESDWGVGVFVCLRFSCAHAREYISVFARPRTPSKHNSLFIPLLQIELLREVSLFLVGAPRNCSTGKQSSLLRSKTLANVMCLHIRKLGTMSCLRSHCSNMPFRLAQLTFCKTKMLNSQQLYF